MGKQELIAGVKERSSQISNNLKSWSKFEWVLFFVIIPLLLFVVFLLPQNVKDVYLIFNTTEIFQVHTIILHAYTHSTFDHLIGNVTFYIFVLAVIFLFENDKKRFWILMGCAFLLVPVINAVFTFIFWNFLNKDTTSQGFSGIAATLSAYALMAFIFWGLHDVMPMFRNTTKLKGREYIGYTVMCVLLAIVIGCIILFGFQLGQFISGENVVSNGIAHFSGFIVGLLVLFLYDILQEDRIINFDVMFAISILMGLYMYIPYLQKLITVVNLGGI
ncbi:MAG: hypothetical protein CVV32_10245 [Methanomicrobiales archaeon HGW-Methanomicrobiales-3]|jgi:hypothetical protein|nr:MAG: hypothetical protein CVV32_10245 [Methanomicrobiales archaeon HGW-Methanomicrobiales-3]